MPVALNIDNWSSKAAIIHQRLSNKRRWMLFVTASTFAIFMISQWCIALTMLGQVHAEIPRTIINSSGLFTVSFVTTQVASYRMASISVYRLVGQVLSSWLLIIVMGLALMLLLRFDYSFWYSACAFVIGTACLGGFAHNLVKRHSQTIGVPGDGLLSAVNAKDITHFIALDGPTLPDTPIDAIAVEQHHLSDPAWTPFLSWCAINAVPVLIINDYLERHSGKVDMENFALGDALRIRAMRPYLSFKRVTDIVIGGTALVLLAVPLAITALVIKLESRGPALFTQRRLGRGGRPFTIYKFRSMRTDAEVKGAQFATSSDPRITRIGRYIRKSRIDELPQLFNVIRGDMSLIGPRPEQVKLMDSLVKEIPLFPLRHSVRPGITGWAQVCQGYADDVASTREKVSYDLFYIKNVSVILDLNIVLRTIRIIISGFGAR